MKKIKRRRRAALFFFDGYISISPSVAGAIVHLQKHGYEVDVFYVRPSETLLTFTPPNAVRLLECRLWSRRIKVMLQQIRGWFLREIRRIRSSRQPDPAWFSHRPAPRLGWRLAAKIFEFGIFCRRHFRSADLAIAFDMTGLAAMTLAVPASTPFIYWSLEILLLDEAKDLTSRAAKKLEMRRLPQACAIAVQSRERANLLALGVTLPAGRIVIVPNSPSGPVPENLARDYFTGRFGISPSTTVVLHAGAINHMVRSMEIAATAPTWPKNFILVFHSNEKRSPQDPYLRAIQAVGGHRVVLSLDPVPFDTVDTIYAGAQIGLVCYDPADANLATAFWASGKLAYYFRHGLPIIVVAEQAVPLVQERGCGVCVKDVCEIGKALKIISADYVRYSHQAKKCYEELFDFGKACDALLALAEGNAVCATAPIVGASAEVTGV